MKVTGTLEVKRDVNQVTDTFKKREAVIKTNEQYPQLLLIEFTQDNVDLLNKYNVGDEVEVSINLKGRKWVSPQGEEKYFTTIQGWKIFALNNEPQSENNQNKPSFEEDGTEDVPF